MDAVTFASVSGLASPLGEGAAEPDIQSLVHAGSTEDVIAAGRAQPRSAGELWNNLVLAGRLSDAQSLADAVPGANGVSGQISETTATSQVALQNVDLKGYQVDLQQQEALGGHTISLHVGKSVNFLTNRIATPLVDTPAQTYYIREASSFSSLASANKLVNYTLSANSDVVEAVAGGKLAAAFVTAKLPGVTGISAVTQGPNNTSLPPNGRASIQETHGVGAYIVHASDVPSGFVVVTAYPTDRIAVPPLFQ